MTAIDRQQLIALHTKYASALVLYARQWCTSPDDAAQEAMIALAEQSPPPQDPAGWLFTATRRRAINQARAEKRRGAHHRRLADCGDAWFGPDLDDAEDREELRAALQSLDSLDRQIVVARIWGELSFQQLAELVDRPLSFVHRRYRGALAALGRRLDPDSKAHPS